MTGGDHDTCLTEKEMIVGLECLAAPIMRETHREGDEGGTGVPG